MDLKSAYHILPIPTYKPYWKIGKPEDWPKDQEEPQRLCPVSLNRGYQTEGPLDQAGHHASDKVTQPVRICKYVLPDKTLRSLKL